MFRRLGFPKYPHHVSSQRPVLAAVTMRFGFERPQPYFGYVGDGGSHLYAQLHSMSRYRLPPDPCLLLQREMDGRV